MSDSLPARPSSPQVPKAARRYLLLLLLGAALLPRLGLMPLNENVHGDSVVRTDLALRWAGAPHWISSFADGAFQFGPLHLYLIGVVLKGGVAPEWAGRVVSLLFGTLTVWPLFSLARRLFGQGAGEVACLGLSVWGIHLQLSTTAASEALALFLLLSALALFARAVGEGRLAPLLGAALVLNLACATRYDAWLLIPLLGLALLTRGGERAAALTRFVLFTLACLPFPLAWMQGNALATGDALYPIHFIERFHREWGAGEVERLGGVLFRLNALLFWPGAALFTLTPPIALFGMVGMARAWRTHPEHRWLLWVCWAPALYYTFKAAVLASFVPMARFTVAQVVLLLPFVEGGFRALTGSAPRGIARAVAGGAAAWAVLFPLGLGAYTFRPEGRIPTSLGPVSPTSTNPPEVMKVARYLEQEVGSKGGALILDSDPRYFDLQIRFFSGVPEDRTVSPRWDAFAERVEEQEPGHLVRIEGGALDGVLTFHEGGAKARLGDRVFTAVPGFSGRYRVYARTAEGEAGAPP